LEQILFRDLTEFPLSGVVVWTSKNRGSKNMSESDQGGQRVAGGSDLTAVAGLKNKRALVTGAGGAIGSAITTLFVAAGARVVAIDRNAESLAGLIDSFGDQIIPVTADVAEPTDMETATNAAVTAWGGLDVAVLCAGIEGTVAEIVDADVADFDKVMAVNVRGVWLGLKYAVGAMKKNGAAGGSIVALSSNAGMAGAAKASIYSASKHAVIGLVRSIAAEVGRDNIRVNAVCPAPIEGRMIQSLERGFSSGRPDKIRQALESKIPLGRYGLPEEVASMVGFLASDQSGFCTGGVYPVDGGKTAI
jgi:NAD(P)-dependent dehydrogenase (short-subunit alcohol dehydrogenase family)